MSIINDDLEEIYQLKMKIKTLKYENRMYKKAAISWMKDYDELKEKYEPEELRESNDN